MSQQLSSTAPAIAAGLTMAQVIGSFQVGWGNRMLAHRMDAAAEAGYVTVPTDLIVPGLQSVPAALGGGLFFTLTIGAFITIFTVGWLRLWAQGLNRPKSGLGLMAIFCAIVLSAIIYHGFDFFLAAYILFVPFSICLLYPWDDARIGAGRQVAAVGRNYQVFNNGRMKWRRNAFLFRTFWLLLPLISLVLMGHAFLGPRMFFDIRDRILLSNPAGRLVNDFYYRYTLFPAESFKSLEQKQVRVFCWVGSDGGENKKEVNAALVANDYLPMSIGVDQDMVIEFIDATTLSFGSGDQAVQITVTDFLDHPHKMLQRVSNVADTHRLLRQLTYVALIAGFPLLIYLMAHGLARRMVSRFFSARVGSMTASVTCCVPGTARILKGEPSTVGVRCLTSP